MKKPFKTYKDYYEFFKSYSLDALSSLRQQIVSDVREGKQEKSKDTSLRLEVIDDLSYMKAYGISVN
jgi:hypothetical protein